MTRKLAGTVKRPMETRWHRNGSALGVGVGIGIAVGVGLDPDADADTDPEERGRVEEE